MSGRVADAKEVIAACRELRASLIRLRALMGERRQSATACERFAESLLGEEVARLKTPTDVKKTLGTEPLVHKVQAILGDRTMQFQEVYAVLLETQHEHRSADLLGDLRRELSRHCNSQGRQLFVRVHQGWYRNRRAGEPEQPRDRTSKGAFVQLLYDLTGKDVVSPQELARRMVTIGERPDRSSPAKISSCLANHADRGTKCFIRVGTG